MLIAIDARESYEPRSGKAYYTRNLIEALIENNPECSFVLYSKHSLPFFANHSNVTVLVIRKRHLFWHLAVLKDWKRRATIAANKQEPTMYFAPTSFIVPTLIPHKFPCAIVVHDTIAFSEKTHQKKAMLIEKISLKRALKHARWIFVPSQNTQHDVETLFGEKLPDLHEKIVVTPLGVSTKFSTTSEVEINRVQEKYNLPEKYILTVAGLEPRKNVTTLIKAFIAIASKFSAYSLVIVGNKGWNNAEAEKLISENPGRIRHIADLASEDLPGVYPRAALFVFPSLYEGFGMPPLEAMASGTPVLCSNTSSLPEVCGDAAVLFNPRSEHELSEKMAHLISHPAEREALIQKGRAHAAGFSWEACARLTYKHLVK